MLIKLPHFWLSLIPGQPLKQRLPPSLQNDYGRARVMVQQMDTDDKLDEAIDTCPVRAVTLC